MLMHFFYLSQRDITIVPSLTCLIFSVDQALFRALGDVDIRTGTEARTQHMDGCAYRGTKDRQPLNLIDGTKVCIGTKTGKNPVS